MSHFCLYFCESHDIFDNDVATLLVKQTIIVDKYKQNAKIKIDLIRTNTV